jgi:GDP-mannose 6-dehydrogenase
MHSDTVMVFPAASQGRLSHPCCLRISVFGIGYVGAVSAACLADAGHGVIAVDPCEARVGSINAGQSPLSEPGLQALTSHVVAARRLRATTSAVEALSQSDVSYVCVGTPSAPNGDLDLTQIVSACEAIGVGLGEKETYHTVVVRSTVLPGTMQRIVIPTLERFSGRSAGRDFGVAFLPEFLREGSALRDYHAGGPIIAGVMDESTEALLHAVVPGTPQDLIMTDLATAEMVKYVANAWHAAKVVFANEVGSICKPIGLDGREVMHLLCKNAALNLSAAYMRPAFAFGGSCLPKDLRALVHQANRVNVQVPMLSSLLPSNEQHLDRALAMVMRAGNRRVGLIGLSFKTGTDDLRESPSVALAERLLGKGYDLRIFDRAVSSARIAGAASLSPGGALVHLARLMVGDLDTIVCHADTLVVALPDFDAAALPPLREHQTLIDLASRSASQRPSADRYEGICW